MGFWSWLKGKTLGGKSVEVSTETLQKYVDQEKMAKLVMEEFTIHAAINLIANCISKCEFKTYSGGKENSGEEYYAWNFESEPECKSVPAGAGGEAVI